jgi:hypothetical protein
MPIPVDCPRCGAKLNAPDSWAGKRVRCAKPNCGKLIPIPAMSTAEVEVDESPPPPSRDVHHSTPHTRERQRGLGGPATIAIIVVSLAALVGIGYGVYVLLGGTRAQTTAGWQEFTYEADRFKAAFPREPKVLRSEHLGVVDEGQVPEFQMGGVTTTFYTCDAPSDPVLINVQVIRHGATIPLSVRELRFDAFQRGFWFVHEVKIHRVLWLGEDGMEIVTRDSVQRMAIKDNTIYKASIAGRRGRATREQEQGFFDSFVALD